MKASVALFQIYSGLPWICAFWLFPMAPGSNPVLLYVSTTEALAAWPLVDLRLVCASCAVDLRLVCAEGSRGVLFLCESGTGPASHLLSDCHGCLLSELF